MLFQSRGDACGWVCGKVQGEMACGSHRKEGFMRYQNESAISVLAVSKITSTACKWNVPLA